MTEPVIGEFEQLVMLALVRQGADAYGVSVCQDLIDRTRQLDERNDDRRRKRWR